MLRFGGGYVLNALKGAGNEAAGHRDIASTADVILGKGKAAVACADP